MKKAIGIFLLMPGSFILLSVLTSVVAQATGVSPQLVLVVLTLAGVGLLASK